MGKTCYLSVKSVSFTLICHALSLPCSFKLDFMLGATLVKHLTEGLMFDTKVEQPFFVLVVV